MTSLLSSSTTPAAAASAVGTDRDERALLRSGIVVGVLFLVAIAVIAVFFATTHPAQDASPIEAAIGFRDASGFVGLGTLLLLLPLPFALLFLGGLSSVFRRIGGGGLGVAAIQSGVVAFTVMAVGAVVSSVVSAIGAADASDATGAVIKALDGVMPLTLALGGLPRAVLLVGTAILLGRAGLVGRPTRVASYIIAGFGVLGSLAFLSPAVFAPASLSMLLFVGWVTVLAIRLPRRRAR